MTSCAQAGTLPSVNPYPSTSLLALDWGTSSARAYRLSAGGAVLDRREAPLGVMQVREGQHAAALVSLLGDWAELRLPRIASGMIGSRQGWIEVPYVDCPADTAALVAGLRTTPGGEMAIVPGLVHRDGDGVPDVLRGEETQIVGAVPEGDEGILAVLPGTHSKWVRVESGRIVSFATYMTGELFALLLQHSILGRLAAPRPPERRCSAPGVRRRRRAGWPDGRHARGFRGAGPICTCSAAFAAERNRRLAVVRADRLRDSGEYRRWAGASIRAVDAGADHRRSRPGRALPGRV